MTSVHYPPDRCRAAIERRVVGLADLQLLDADRLGQPLGPGYTPPPTEDQVARRMDNCDLSRETCQQYLTLHTCTKWRHGKAWLRHMERTHNKLIRDISNKSVGYEGFAYNLDDYENYYHSNGHMRISTACSAMKHNRTYGVMASAAELCIDFLSMISTSLLLSSVTNLSISTIKYSLSIQPNQILTINFLDIF